MNKKLEVVCTFTESPSFNVSINLDGEELFYNSERLQGNDRARKAGTILGLKHLRVGTKIVDATDEQIKSIINISEMGYCPVVGCRCIKGSCKSWKGGKCEEGQLIE